MATSRNYQIVNLRVLAIMSVVLGHSCIIYDGYWNTYPAAYNSTFFMWLKAVITAYQMQLFFAISGFLFYYTSRKHTYIEIVKKKSKRLLIPFFFVGLCWLIPVRLIAHYPKYGGSYISGIIEFLNSDWGHLWFLPVLFVLFICLYHLLKLNCKSSKELIDIGILIVCLLIGFGSKFLPLHPLFKLSLNWAFWFVLGFYLCNKTIKLPNRKSMISTMILITTIFSILLLPIEWEGLIGKAIGFVVSLLIVMSLFLYVSNRSSEMINYLDKNSMGIFLFHSPIIYVLYDRFAMVLPPFAMVSLNFVVSVIISIFITMVIRKVGFSFLIGE